MERQVRFLVIVLAVISLFGCGEKQAERTDDGGTSIRAGEGKPAEEDIVVDLGEDQVLKATVAAMQEKEEDKAAEQPPPERPKPSGKMTLIDAIKANDTAAAVALIDEGAEVNSTSGDEHEFTPMMYAAGTGNIDVIKALVENGAELDATSAAGQTALIWAARGGSAEVAEYLLDKGADPNIKDAGGKTALDWARLNNNEALHALLEKHSNADGESMEQPEESEAEEVVQDATEE